MTDEKQIEEIAKDIFESKVAIDGSDMAFGLFDEDDHFHRIARFLYKHNCRKLPESAVVLTKEEHTALINEFNALQHKYNDICDRYRLCRDANETIKQHAVMVRKETAREFAKDLLQELDLVGYDKSDFCVIAVKVVAKQYGIEVEE